MMILDGDDRVRPSSMAYDKRVAGVVSGTDYTAVKVHPDDKWEVLPNPGKPNDGQAIMQPKLL
jgi:hypothetical protein